MLKIYFRFHFRFNEFKVRTVPCSIFEVIKPEQFWKAKRGMSIQEIHITWPQQELSTGSHLGNPEHPVFPLAMQGEGNLPHPETSSPSYPEAITSFIRC